MVDFSSSAEEKEKEKDRDDKEKEKEREPLLWSGDVLRLTQVCPLPCYVTSCHVMSRHVCSRRVVRWSNGW